MQLTLFWVYCTIALKPALPFLRYKVQGGGELGTKGGLPCFRHPDTCSYQHYISWPPFNSLILAWPGLQP